MLTYMEVHLYFTLPVLGILGWLLRPFHSEQDSLKYKFLVTMAVSTASIWDNYIVYHRAWSYCPKCVVAVIGYVPLEEYLFFIIMTLMTVGFTNFVMRWSLPSSYIRPETPLRQTIFVRLVPSVILLIIGAKAWFNTVPNNVYFYGSCILWYTCPVLALLWYGSGEYMLRRWKSVITCVVVPTIYLCWVDKVAISAGTWYISTKTSTGTIVVKNLPLEEFMFFFLVNVLLVFATTAIDRAQALIHLFQSRSINKTNSRTALTQMGELVWAFILPDQCFSSQTVSDLSVSWFVLKESSKSFHTASSVFSYDIRQDLGVLYGFCRATDDLCDNENVSVEKRKGQLEVTRSFVHHLFGQKTNTPIIDWEYYYSELPKDCVATFRTFVRLRHVLEVEAVDELLDGYKWDLERRPVLNSSDLRDYSACVASSVGEMCTRIILNAGNTQNAVPNDWIIERAREMGLVLQYTNIARDIVTDSKELGRCYLPADRLTSEELNLVHQGQVRKLGDKRLHSLAMGLIDEADELMRSAEVGILALPKHTQGGVRAACNVYAAIGDKLRQSNGAYPDRAFVSKKKRAFIALQSVYNMYPKKCKNQNHPRQRKNRSVFVE
ncbi:lycopene cyclase [Backusella circina FSU 941]|nr:lycopene cyclase [Backusella circina FSU 941]